MPLGTSIPIKIRWFGGEMQKLCLPEGMGVHVNYIFLNILSLIYSYWVFVPYIALNTTYPKVKTYSCRLTLLLTFFYKVYIKPPSRTPPHLIISPYIYFNAGHNNHFFKIWGFAFITHSCKKTSFVTLQNLLGQPLLSLPLILIYIP